MSVRSRRYFNHKFPVPIYHFPAFAHVPRVAASTKEIPPHVSETVDYAVSTWACDIDKIRFA